MCGGDMGTCAAATPEQPSQGLVEARQLGCSGSSATMSDVCSTPVAGGGAGMQPSASAAWPPGGNGAHAEPEPASDSAFSSCTTHVAESTGSSGRPANSADSRGSAGTQVLGLSTGAGAAPAAPEDAALADGREAGTAVSDDGEGAGMLTAASAVGGAGGTPAANAEPAAGADRAAQGSSAGARASELQEKLVKQVEFYFSDENLPTDAFLLKQVSRSPEGWGAPQTALYFCT